jgi:methyl-accepting chemotaxis protein WspA
VDRRLDGTLHTTRKWTALSAACRDLIIQQVQALAPRFEAVSEGMGAQATGAEQITQALAQLSEAAQQTVESLHQSGQAIDGLNQAATSVRSGVSRFKLAA